MPYTIRVSASNFLLDIILRILSQKQSKKGCSHGTIAIVTATAIYSSQLMGCVGFSVIVAIPPCEHLTLNSVPPITFNKQENIPVECVPPAC